MLKKFIALTLITLPISSCAGKPEVPTPRIIIEQDVCSIPPVYASKEAKCFLYDTCKEWEADAKGRRTFCKSWPTGFKNFMADLAAHNKTLLELQPACTKPLVVKFEDCI